MQLSDIGESGFLERVRAWVGGSHIGDDAAVLPTANGQIAVTTDALVGGVHFRLDWSTPADVGWKAVAVNVSDIAAMGARPRWITVAVCAPPDTDEKVLAGIYDGMSEACSVYDAEIVGGDTTSASELVLSVTAIGELDGPPLLRSGARDGDVLAVSGPLGRAAAGVNLLLSQDPKKVDPDDAFACMDAHRRPAARVDVGLRLRELGAHAAMDISDGLAIDVRRLAGASGVGVEIDADAVPVATEARRVAAKRGWDIDAIALGGGEDYELLVALAPGDLDASGLTPIGRVVASGLTIVRAGERSPLPEAGFDHFSAR